MFWHVLAVAASACPSPFWRPETAFRPAIATAALRIGGQRFFTEWPTALDFGMAVSYSVLPQATETTPLSSQRLGGETPFVPVLSGLSEPLLRTVASDLLSQHFVRLTEHRHPRCLPTYPASVVRDRRLRCRHLPESRAQVSRDLTFAFTLGRRLPVPNDGRSAQWTK